jgi:hypothetical protein
MADYYKSLSLEKQRQFQSLQMKEDILCTESLNKQSLSKGTNNNNKRASGAFHGYSSSSDDLQNLNKSSGDEAYVDNSQFRIGLQTPVVAHSSSL